ncbi:MAG: methyltransferase domain-containing protein, partial [Nocardioides sp.]|uniref:class I SAM-dependent methyltransferase n=1 Tax=Nocardioides sp. TaxID=35761 RepID=UPI003266C68B
MREPDAAFADPRQAVLYDAFDDERADLDSYVAIAEEMSADQVIDIGCGTGSLAVRLAGLGKSVIGVDPAGASLDVARAKPGAAAVTWIHGDATTLPDLAADLATMTGNVAQVFLADD